MHRALSVGLKDSLAGSALFISRKDRMTLEEKRDELLRKVKIEEKDEARKAGYFDGVLDMYNEAKRIEVANAGTKLHQ